MSGSGVFPRAPLRPGGAACHRNKFAAGRLGKGARAIEMPQSRQKNVPAEIFRALAIEELQIRLGAEPRRCGSISASER